MFKKLVIKLLFLMFCIFINSSYCTKIHISQEPLKDLNQNQINKFFEILKNDEFDEINELIKSNHNYINIKDISGWTILHHLVSRNEPSNILNFLTFEDVNIEVVDIFGQTPLHIASLYGQLWAVDLLTSYSANINAADKNGVTPIHIALNHLNIPLIDLLISKGANINATKEIHIASKDGDFSKVNLLISKGVDVNDKDCDGNTPLHTTIKNAILHFYSNRKYLLLVQLLISQGADINAVDNNGNTPLDVLENNIDSSYKDVLNNWELIAMLYKFISKIKGYEQDNIVTSAIEGNINVWKNLNAEIINDSINMKHLEYALFIAAANGQSQFFNNIYMILTQYDRDIDLSLIMNRYGSNVIDVAFSSFNPKMIATIRLVNEAVFNNYLNINVNKISRHLTVLFSNKYSNLVREINNPRDDTNVNELIEEMHSSINNYIDICRYLINNFQLDRGMILQSFNGIKNIDTTLTGALEKYNVKGQDIYDHIKYIILLLNYNERRFKNLETHYFVKWKKENARKKRLRSLKINF